MGLSSLSQERRHDRSLLFLYVVVGLLVVPYATGFISFYYEEGLFPVQPWIYLLGLAALTCLAAARARPRITSDHALLLAVMLWRLISSVVRECEPSLEAGVTTRELAGSFIFMVAVCCLTGDPRLMRGCLLGCATATLAITIGLNVFEWFRPGTFSSSLGRSAGWLVNPNGSAVVISSMLGFLLTLRLSPFLSVLAAIGSLVGVYLTLSRGGFLVVVGVCVAFFLLNLRFKLKGLFTMLLLAAGVVSIALIFTDLGWQFASSEVAERELSLRTGTGLIDLDDSRVTLASESLEAILERPWIGYGPGYSVSYFSPHNQLMAVWLDGGAVPALLFLAAVLSYVVSCLRSGVAYVTACVAVVGWIPFSHNMLEDKVFLFGFVITSAMAAHLRARREGPRTGPRALFQAIWRKSSGDCRPATADNTRCVA